MKIIDPHIDLADFYKLNGWGVDDFNGENSSAWVTLPKLKQCGVEVIGLTLYFDESFLKTNYHDGVKSFYEFYQQLLGNNDGLVPIKIAKDLTTKPADKIGYFYTIEGFECLREPNDFDEFYSLGVRSFGLTWSFDNSYACGRHTKNDRGLTKQGLEVIGKMKQKQKLIVDIAHLSEQSVKDLDKSWPGMMVTTHGNCRSIYKTKHNLADDEIQIIVDRGGVVSLFPLTEDTGPRASFDDLYKHLDYIAGKVGLGLCGLF